MIDFIAFRSLNGVLLILFSGFILLLKRVITLPKKRGDKKNSHIALKMFTVLLMLYAFAYWKYDSQADGKMKNLASDIVYSWDIQKSKYWQLTSTSDKDGLLQDANGRSVGQSTYLRVSWFRYGLGLLTQNPLGIGYTHAAFDYYMQKHFPGSRAHKTHSGWLDFALGIGLPGLFLTWGSIFIVAIGAFQGIRAMHNVSQYVALWGLVGVWLLWWIAELSEREFIEHLFFMLALLSGSIKPAEDSP